MKIIYLHQYFNTPEQGGSLRSYYIARAMVVAGHEVSLITTHNKKEYAKINIEGFEVHYLPVIYRNGFSFWRRIHAFFNFAQASYKLAKKLPQHNLIYATSTPLTVGLTALWLKKKLKIPYIFEVRDLWPLVPIRLGILRNPIAQWLTQRWEKKIYQNAQQIIALSPAMQTHVQAIVPHKTVHLIPNMADATLFSLPAPPKNESKERKKFIVAYLGTISYANHLPYLVEIARFCSLSHTLFEIEFWIVGKGAKLPEVQALSLAYQLENVRFFSYQNTYNIHTLMAQVDAVYVSFLNNPVLESTSPNKFFEALGAGKLCIVNTKGWLRELVETHACGFYADPNAPESFLAQLTPFLENQALLASYQQNAQILAKKEFSVEVLTKKLMACIDLEISI